MKNSLIFIILLLLFLTSCKEKKISIYNDSEITQFEELFKNIGNGNTKAYDLRPLSQCEQGRIPKFYCSRITDSLGNERSIDTVFERLKTSMGNDYNKLIILIDENGEDSKYLAEKLFNVGFYNVHYFEKGYSRYVEIKGEEFSPEVGPCDVC